MSTLQSLPVVLLALWAKSGVIGLMFVPAALVGTASLVKGARQWLQNHRSA